MVTGEEMKKSFFLIVFAFAVLLAHPAQAYYTVSFGDTAIYFPGWGNGTDDDSRDVIGLPDILGGKLIYDDNYHLVSIQFSFIVTQEQNLWSRLTPGDLFIDLGADQTWDYTVGTFGATDWNNVAVNGVSVPLAGPGYVMSGADGLWNGYNIRDDHPIAVEGGIPYSSASFSGWPPGVPEDVVWVTYLFDPEFSIDIRNGLIVGWTLNCANDVLYEKIDIPLIYIPEPATLILLGIGVLFIVLLIKRRKNGPSKKG